MVDETEAAEFEGQNSPKFNSPGFVHNCVTNPGLSLTTVVDQQTL